MSTPIFLDTIQTRLMMSYAVATEQGIESHVRFKRGKLLLNRKTVPFLKDIDATLDVKLLWTK